MFIEHEPFLQPWDPTKDYDEDVTDAEYGHVPERLRQFDPRFPNLKSSVVHRTDTAIPRIPELDKVNLAQRNNDFAENESFDRITAVPIGEDPLAVFSTRDHPQTREGIVLRQELPTFTETQGIFEYQATMMDVEETNPRRAVRTSLPFRVAAPQVHFSPADNQLEPLPNHVHTPLTGPLDPVPGPMRMPDFNGAGTDYIIPAVRMTATEILLQTSQAKPSTIGITQTSHAIDKVGPRLADRRTLGIKVGEPRMLCYQGAHQTQPGRQREAPRISMSSNTSTSWGDVPAPVDAVRAAADRVRFEIGAAPELYGANQTVRREDPLGVSDRRPNQAANTAQYALDHTSESSADETTRQRAEMPPMSYASNSNMLDDGELAVVTPSSSTGSHERVPVSAAATLDAAVVNTVHAAPGSMVKERRSVAATARSEVPVAPQSGGRAMAMSEVSAAKRQKQETNQSGMHYTTTAAQSHQPSGKQRDTPAAEPEPTSSSYTPQRGDADSSAALSTRNQVVVPEAQPGVVGHQGTSNTSSGSAPLARRSARLVDVAGNEHMTSGSAVPMDVYIDRKSTGGGRTRKSTYKFK